MSTFPHAAVLFALASAFLFALTNHFQSLGLESGQLVVGAPADVVGWDLPHERALLQPWGTPKAKFVLRDGVRLV